MKFVAWLTDGTWQACVDAVAEVAPPDAEIVLLHVIDPSMTEGLHGAYAGLFGRGGRGPDPGDAIEVATLTAEAELFAAAEARARREAPRASHRGRPEREVIAAAADAALLVVAKGQRPLSLGPHSLGRAPASSWIMSPAACCSSGRMSHQARTPFRRSPSTMTNTDQIRRRCWTINGSTLA